MTERYFHAARIDSDLIPGHRIAYWCDDDLVVGGRVLESDAPRWLVTTWSFRRSPEMRDDPPSRVTWQIEPVALDAWKLTLVHDEFSGETPTFQRVRSAGHGC